MSQNNKKKNMNIVYMPVNSEEDFYYYWLIFLKPFHPLVNKEMIIAAEFLYQRQLLSEVISDSELIDTALLSKDTAEKIKEKHKISDSYYKVIISNFRKNGFIQEERINPKYIPNREFGEKTFQLTFHFDLRNVDKDKELQ
jgi:hypothetical protein|nr:MAG TPA: hypothetical protein [Caudoviricetes sp.]